MTQTPANSAPQAKDAPGAPDTPPKDVPQTPPEASAPAQKTIRQKKTVVLLRKGDMRQGVVKKVLEDKGAFIDIGVGKDGFLPRSLFRYNDAKSQASRYIRQGDEVRVWIHRLDREKNDIILTLIRPDYKTIHKLEIGEKRLGFVQSVLDYGAFIDIGSDKDGLLPVSRLAQERVADIHQELKEGDALDVWVTEVRAPKGEKWQINVSRLPPGIRVIDDLQRGSVVTGTVRSFNAKGACLDIQVGEDAVLPLHEIDHYNVVDAAEELEIGQELEVLILRVNGRKRYVEVSRRRLLEPPAEQEMEHVPAMDEEPPMSAMELAFMKARREQHVSRKKQRRKRKAQIADTQDDIIARTLQSGSAS